MLLKTSWAKMEFLGCLQELVFCHKHTSTFLCCVCRDVIRCARSVRQCMRRWLLRARLVSSSHMYTNSLACQCCKACLCCRRVRVFWYASGRLRRVYDESLAAAAELQRSDSDLYRLDPIDFGRRVAAEKDLEADAAASKQNALFDDSGNFIIYSTLLGIKVCGPSPCLETQCVRKAPLEWHIWPATY